jgi:chromosome segregation ATPase
MTDWKTCARCACKDAKRLCASGWCSQLREEAEAALAGQAAAYNVLAERLDAKLAAEEKMHRAELDELGLFCRDTCSTGQRIAALERKLAVAEEALRRNLEETKHDHEVIERDRARIAALEADYRKLLADPDTVRGARIIELEAARDKALDTAEEFRAERDEAKAELRRLRMQCEAADAGLKRLREHDKALAALGRPRGRKL